VANYYTATYPNSFFPKKVMVHLPGPAMRVTLVNRRVIERRADGASETMLADDEAILEVLAARFGLQFAAGTRFPYVEE
jgi:N-hydroxyarylamine O-acetyltransferase